MKATRRTMRLLAAGAALALVATACSSDDPAEDPSDEMSDEMSDGMTEGMEDLGGADVTIFGAFTSVEADAVNTVIEDMFNTPYNANAVYEGSESFEEQVKIRIDGGNPPDVALHPQPGTVVEQAEEGNAIALEDLGFTYDELVDTFGEYLLSLGEYDGKHYGIPTNVNLKSLVWYNLPIFEAQGYTVPESWDDLVALSQTMVDDGFTPFCIGTGSEAATGWPATDWMEDIMLRTAGAEKYDMWVTNELTFSSDEVTRAAEIFAEIAFNDDFISGSTSDIPDVDFRDAPKGLTTPSVEEPGCLMHRQASFIVNFFAENAVVGENIGVFAFPAIDPGVSGALIAGELGAVYRDGPEVRAFLHTFIGDDVQCAMGSQEGVQRISPNVNTTAACYGDDVVATSAGAILDALIAGGARFDASDLMPAEVGQGSFWTGMNEWMRGKDTATVLSEIDASWPA